MSERTLIPAVMYLRKSTKGRRKDGKERQEKSLSQQRKELTELAKRHGYSVVRVYEDAGVSGTKGADERPGFGRMLSDAGRRKDFKAILVDDMDRFSREEVMDVYDSFRDLARRGVTTVHCCNQGHHDLSKLDSGIGIGDLLKMTVDVHAGNEYSRKLARRITLSRRNFAKEGKISGGGAPYGLASTGTALEGKGGLVHGDKAEIKIVRRIFDEFVNRRGSLSGIAGRLNAEKVPAPRGDTWYVRTVRGILTRVAYRGDFQYGATRQGRFYTLNDEHEVVSAEGREAVAVTNRIVIKGCYKPLIDPALFDAAQRRLATFGKVRTVRRRAGYALTGVIICDHCGRPCYGMKPGKHVIYRCNSKVLMGKGSCGNYQIREDHFLPQLAKLLSQEVISRKEKLEEMILMPPENLTDPNRDRVDDRRGLQREHDKLEKEITFATTQLMSLTTDPRTRRDIDVRISEMRDRLDEIAARLSAEQPGESYTRAEIEKLNAWHEDFYTRAISVPIPKGVELPHAVEAFWQDPFSEERALLIDPLVVNEKLAEIGSHVRVRWTSEMLVERHRHKVDKMRIQVGKQSTELGQCATEPNDRETWSGD